MALSKRAKDALKRAMTDKRAADELSAAIDAGGNVQAASVAALGATSNLSALVPTASVITDSAGTYAVPAEPTGAEVDTAINELRDKVETALDLKADNADAETLRTQVESRLDAVEGKADAIIAALKTAGLMAT